jgi:hypothetical protein
MESSSTPKFLLPVALLVMVLIAFCGCKTTDALGDPIRTIDNPYNRDEYQKTSDSYVRNMELWRKDPEAVTQVEIYKLEGKSAVIMDRKTLVAERDHQVLQVTTRKYIYVFYLDLPSYIEQAWWVSRIEVYSLASQRPEDNPGLKTDTPKLREPSSLTPIETDAQDPAPPDLDSGSTLP